MDEALQAKLESVLQKATAFAYLIEQAGPQGSVSGADSTGGVTFWLAAGGVPDHLQLAPSWRQLLRGGSLAAAIQEAHDKAQAAQIEKLVRPFAKDAYRGLDEVAVPAEFRDRYLEQAKRSGAGPIPTDLRDTNEQMSRLRDEFDEAFRRADRLEEELAAGATDPADEAVGTGPADRSAEPVRFSLRGHTVVEVQIDPRWERNIPADQAQEVINQALLAELPTKED